MNQPGGPEERNLPTTDGPASFAPNPAGLDARTMMRYDANKKSMLLTYLLWFCLGYFGVHRFYMGRTGSAIAILGITIVSTVLAFVAVGFLGYIVVGVWLIVDIFLIPGITREFNNDLIDRLTA